MKRFIAITLTSALALSLFGCGAGSASETTAPTAESAVVQDFAVPSPMADPVYTFDHEPTSDELRETAVRAMKDLLSIQWCTDIEIAYYKTGPVSKKRFEHLPMNIYAGTIYSNASTGLFQFMEFYDQETGKFSYPAPVYKMKEALGNSCADSLLWGYSTVCNSIQGGFFPATMVYANGYLPVGNYSYKRDIKSYVQDPTNEIVKRNGDNLMMQCYSMVKPADSLVSSTANHAMMVVGNPNVVYNDDGTINMEGSYVPIQDQRGGDGNGFYDQTIDGNVVHYSGRTYYEFPFSELLEKHYIPLTTAEFAGSKAYDKATVTLDNTDFTTVKEFLATTVTSNYPLAIIRATLIDGKGNETVVARRLFGGKEETGVPRTFAFQDLLELNTYKTSVPGLEGAKIRVEVVVSTGEEFQLAELPI